MLAKAAKLELLWHKASYLGKSQTATVEDGLKQQNTRTQAKTPKRKLKWQDTSLYGKMRAETVDTI